MQPALLNAVPAIVTSSGGRTDLAVVIEADGGHVTGLYLVRNPDKPGGVAAVRPLGR